METHILPFRKMPLPQRLIYKHPTTRIIFRDAVNTADFDAYEYRMCDTQTGEYLGRMIAGPMVCDKSDKKYFYPKNNKYKSFFIDGLYPKYSGEGIGTDFIKLAKKESMASDCCGRVHLVASRIYDPSRPPHIFYRKCGFISNKPNINKYIDRCIKYNRKMHWSMADNLPMYLPEKQVMKKSHKLLGKVIKFLSKIIH